MREQTKFQIVNNADYLLQISNNTLIANNSATIPFHTEFKEAQLDSEITTGVYYPKCDKIVIWCDTAEKAQKLYGKYSEYKKAKGNGVFTNEPAFKTIVIKKKKKTYNKFKLMQKEMIDNNYTACHYRFGAGIGPEFNENDFICFFKWSAVETIKNNAPHIYKLPYITLTPMFKIAKDSQNLLLKKSKRRTDVMHSVVNFN